MFAVDQHATTVSKAGDVIAVGITLGALMQYLPAVATILSIVWLLLQITRFCVNWRREEKRRRGQRRRRGDYHGISNS